MSLKAMQLRDWRKCSNKRKEENNFKLFCERCQTKIARLQQTFVDEAINEWFWWRLSAPVSK